MNGPFTIKQDTQNCLIIVDRDGVTMCQFYEEEADEVTAKTEAMVQFVLDAMNEKWARGDRLRSGPSSSSCHI